MAKVAMKKEEAPKEKVVAKKEAKPAKAPTAQTGYGVAYICEQMGIEPFTVRQKLRKSKTAKNGKSYSWDKKSDVDAVIKTLKATKLKGE